MSGTGTHWYLQKKYSESAIGIYEMPVAFYVRIQYNIAYDHTDGSKFDGRKTAQEKKTLFGKVSEEV